MHIPCPYSLALSHLTALGPGSAAPTERTRPPARSLVIHSPGSAQSLKWHSNFIGFLIARLWRDQKEASISVCSPDGSGVNGDELANASPLFVAGAATWRLIDELRPAT